MKTLPRTDIVIVGGGWTGLAASRRNWAHGRRQSVVGARERRTAADPPDYFEGMDELD